MVRVRLNLVGYVMLTMAAFWGAFSAFEGWKMPVFSQFLIFAGLVVVWSLASIAMMTWSGKMKARDAEREELVEREREASVLAAYASHPDEDPGDPSLAGGV